MITSTKSNVLVDFSRRVRAVEDHTASRNYYYYYYYYY